jgi:Tol biopolymer transport system component
MDAAGSRTFPTGSQPELYKVSVNGGRVEQVLTTPAEDIKLSKNGRYLIYQDKKGGENTWRKHHTSSIAQDIWIYDSQAGTHKKVTSFPGEDRNPIFTDNDKSFYYLSEESGSFNISMPPRFSKRLPSSTTRMRTTSRPILRTAKRSLMSKTG